MTEGKASTPEQFFERRQPVRLHVQLGLRLAQGHGVLLVGPAARARPRASTGACRRSAPASYEWQGFLAEDQHPHAIGGPERPAAELEQPARRRASCTATTSPSARSSASSCSTSARPGRRCRDDVERHEPRRHRGRALAGVAGRQPGAARGHRRRTRSTSRWSGILDDWVAPRRPAARRRQRRHYDEPGPAIMDALWPPARRGGDAPVSSATCSRTSTTSAAWAACPGESYVDKDLRTLLGDPVRGQVQPALLRQRLARGMPGVAVGGARHGPSDIVGLRQGTPIRPPGAARPAARASARA